MIITIYFIKINNLFISALYGVLFAKDEEAAFSNYRLWESLGFILVFAYNTYLCIRVKLYVLISFLAVGMIGYIIIEVRVKTRKRPQEKQIRSQKTLQVAQAIQHVLHVTFKCLFYCKNVSFFVHIMLFLYTK